MNIKPLALLILSAVGFAILAHTPATSQAREHSRWEGRDGREWRCDRARPCQRYDRRDRHERRTTITAPEYGGHAIRGYVPPRSVILNPPEPRYRRYGESR
ncbi:hypothetical protein [Thiocapsa marina]|uniref:Uncharacterized protein n=1 Tax=Thiocapsa marina 5811 TaxID=768671 RepID=F9UD51_9GAMM|nr:hypothetical protein [Thiocapsa marina]EGV17795.1 hypothetical protein ThimaDRAFT_2854 [Thiocapsa marina 5811]